MLQRSVLRWFVLCAVLGLVIAPTLPLLVSAFSQESTSQVWTPVFTSAVATSLLLAFAVAVLALVIGLPLGLLSALYWFPGRFWLLPSQVLPLLLPSFLPSIGWSNLEARLWPAWMPAPRGFWGCVFVLGLQALPLVLLATWAACYSLTASQIEAARLHGGERSVLFRTAQACAPVAVLTSLLAGVLSLSDPGAPLILGCRSVAIEIRTSFAALFDFDLASRQCLALAGLVLLLAAPLVAIGLRRLDAAVLARQTRPASAHRHRTLGSVAWAGLIALLVAGVLVPALGLCLPVVQNPMFARAWEKAAPTAWTTALFTGGAGLTAVVLATVLALASAGHQRLRTGLLGVMLVLLALPPSLAALGVIQLATQAPSQLDWLFRGSPAVFLVLGFRFLPVATLVMMRAAGSLSPSWSQAARLHGVRPARFIARVVLPLLAPAMATSGLVVIVLAAADITTTHLLQPPGRQSLPVAIFTIMANSPEGLVGSLCLLYVLAVVSLLIAATQFSGWRRGRLP